MGNGASILKRFYPGAFVNGKSSIVGFLRRAFKGSSERYRDIQVCHLVNKSTTFSSVVCRLFKQSTNCSCGHFYTRVLGYMGFLLRTLSDRETLWSKGFSSGTAKEPLRILNNCNVMTAHSEIPKEKKTF